MAGKALPGLAHLLIGQPDLPEALMRSLGLKGTLPQFIEPELNVGITALDLSDAEFAWLRRNVRLQWGIQLAAVAAQFSQAVLAPIAGAARTMCVVEKLIICNTTGVNQNYFVDLLPSALAFAAATLPRSAMDDRAIPFNSLQPTPTFGWVGATAAAALVTGAAFAHAISVPASSIAVLDFGWVLTARTVLNTPAPAYLIVANQAVNLPLTVSAVWRERTLLASEAS